MTGSAIRHDTKFIVMHQDFSTMVKLAKYRSSSYLSRVEPRGRESLLDISTYPPLVKTNPEID
jgi:hypothetical protein